MKNILRLGIFTIILTIFSCSQEDNQSDQFQELNIKPKIENLNFENAFQYDVTKKNYLNNLIKEYSKYLFDKEISENKNFIGFDIHISAKETVIKPITLDGKSISAFAHVQMDTII